MRSFLTALGLAALAGGAISGSAISGSALAAEHGFHHPTSLPANFKCDGHVVKRMFHSAALNRDRQYYVYTPPGYDAPGNSRRYPVLYMLHGCPGHPLDWVMQGGAIATYESLFRQKRVSPWIMVFPDGEGPRFEFDCTGFLNKSDGTWNMEDAVARDQVAEVDSQYRTLADPADRGVLGLSAGGYAAVNLGVRHPDVFGVMVSHSGYFNAGDFAPIPKKMIGTDPSQWGDVSPYAVISARGLSPHQHFYLDIGDDDELLPGNRTFASLLSRDGADYTFRVYHGAHTFAAWRAQLPYSFAFVDRCFASAGTTLRTAEKNAPAAAKMQ